MDPRDPRHRAADGRARRDRREHRPADRADATSASPTARRQWIVTAYALAFGSLLLLGGRIADLIGRKWVFLVGLVGFALASAVGGAATNFGMLVGARAVQGAFGALLAPAVLSLLTTTFTEAEGARQGVRHLRRHRRCRCGDRPAARRRPHRVRLLALDDVRQPDLRRRSRSSAGCLLDHQHGARTRPKLDMPGTVRGLGRPVRPRLRLLARRDRTAGATRSPSAASIAAAVLLVAFVADRDGAPRTRCCRCAWSSTATAAAPSSRCSPPRPGMFARLPVPHLLPAAHRRATARCRPASRSCR